MPASRRSPNAWRSTSPTMRPSSASARTRASASSWSGRRRRWSPGSPTISKPPASRCSARPRRRRSSKAPRASPRISAPSTASPPPPIAASATPTAAKAYVATPGAPIVIKADGLAAGKGVIIAADARRGRGRHRCLLRRRASARPGAEVVIEEFLEGEEASFFALVDGDDRAAARHRAGPQARLRRRPGPQHRRHGRLFAGADHDAERCARASWTRSSCRRCAP